MSRLQFPLVGIVSYENSSSRSFSHSKTILAYSLNGEVIPEFDWHKVKEEFLAESNEEEQMIAVKSLTMTRDWPRPKVGLDASSFQKLIDNGPRYESLLTLKAFWRRGMAAIKRFEFLDAFL